MFKRTLLGISLLSTLLPVYAGAAECTVLIKPTKAWNTTGGDDLERLKQLTMGVGWEMNPNAETNARLKKIGMRAIRVINVDLQGHFGPDGKFVVDDPSRLMGNLNTCRELGARPHIILITSLPVELQYKEKDTGNPQTGVMGNMASTTVFGPTNWEMFSNYVEATFKFILIDQNFPDATFELGNEPDIGGGFNSSPPKKAMGSRASYEDCLAMYKAVSQVATKFEQEHPGIKVRLGGPALAWAFTFKFGDFNWTERFLRDCQKYDLKLDFLGIHFYGNMTSLEGQYDANFPSFVDMLNTTKAARDKYRPGTPIWFTEWGPSFHGIHSPDFALISSDNRGAAWSAKFLSLMLESGVEGALYLCTTDMVGPLKDGKQENLLGWPALFTNPLAFTKAYPHPTFHVFDMISRLEGVRVEATRGNKALNCLAFASADKSKVSVILWNYDVQIPESGLPIDNAQSTGTVLRIKDANAFFKTKQVSFKRWLISGDISNVVYELKKGVPPSDQSELQQTDSGNFRILDDSVDIGFNVPPSSVSLIEIVAEK